MAMVSQEPALFAGSIEENIKYGEGNATEEDVNKVAEDANAHEFISNLKDGYKTDVGESGSQLSGKISRSASPGDASLHTAGADRVLYKIANHKHSKHMKHVSHAIPSTVFNMVTV